MPSFQTTETVPFTAQQMFDLVADIEAYPQFLPLCEALRIRERRTSDSGHPQLIADMTCGYKAIRETFTSRVTLVGSRKPASSSNISTAPSVTFSTNGVLNRRRRAMHRAVRRCTSISTIRSKTPCSACWSVPCSTARFASSCSRLSPGQPKFIGQDRYRPHPQRPKRPIDAL